MTFLSKDTIEDRFDEIFPKEYNDDIELGDNKEPASFELRLGHEAFLSGEKNLINLNSMNPVLKIEPGDLAILLTKEKITMPCNLIGFISIKLKYKNMGLVNISGFHVDPGFKGHLTFSVYNAGPNDIILRYAEKLFVIFFSTVDNPTVKHEGEHTGQEHISSNAMNMLTGRSVSPQSLDARLGTLENRFQLVWALLLALTGGIVLAIFKVFFSNG